MASPDNAVIVIPARHGKENSRSPLDSSAVREIDADGQGTGIVFVRE